MPNLAQEAEGDVMESPLDMLSRAASMLETGHLHSREAAMKRPAEIQAGPGLPPKMAKLQRMQDRQASHSPPSPLCPRFSPPARYSPPVNSLSPTAKGHSPTAKGHSPTAKGLSPTAKNHLPPVNSSQGGNDSPDTNRRCAGTQTSFSSFGRESYSGKLTEMDQAARLRLAGHHYLRVPLDQENTPLNLSISGSSSPQHRPSVITCNTRPLYPNFPLPHAKPSDIEMCDPAIEEHFRRSLGHMYSGVKPRTPEEPPAMPPATPSSPKVTQCSTPEVKVVTVYSESVDDHFAKSLGDTWKQIKAQDEPEKKTDLEESVDDHFAKALGATWHKIKEESESASHTSSSRSPSPSSQHFARSLGSAWNPPPYSAAPKWQRMDSTGSDHSSAASPASQSSHTDSSSRSPVARVSPASHTPSRTSPSRTPPCTSKEN